MNFVVVAYYTDDSIYRRHAEKLIESLEKFNIKYHIEQIDDKGGWYANTNYKPTFIKNMLIKFKESSIAYVDCDAEFVKEPELFYKLNEERMGGTFIAAHSYERHSSKPYRKPELLSGTLFLRNCKETLSLVKRWERECKHNPKRWDQKNLDAVLHNNFYKLPAQYCKIFDTMKHVDDPVIIHYQASREAKKINR